MHTNATVILFKKPQNNKTKQKNSKAKKKAKYQPHKKPQNKPQGLCHTLSLPLSEDPPPQKISKK